jgi:NAD(P)H-dependent FMN reductase
LLKSKYWLLPAVLGKIPTIKSLVQQAAEIARQKGAKVTVIDLIDYPMPLYDGDVESKQGLPASAKKLRDLMISSDAIIIASPGI